MQKKVALWCIWKWWICEQFFLASSELTVVPKLRAKKVVSDNPGLVDFAIGLVNLVVNLSDGQVIFFEEFQ